MSLHESISARFCERDVKILLLEMAAEIEKLQQRIKYLEVRLPDVMQQRPTRECDYADDSSNL